MTKDEIALLSNLAARDSVNINCIKQSSRETPLMLLCRHNQSGSLYPALKELLKWKEIDLSLTNSRGHSALTLLCRYNGHTNLIDCLELLVKNGVNIKEKITVKKSTRNALDLLSLYYRGQNLMDIVLLLLKNGAELSAEAEHELRSLNPAHSEWFDQSLPMIRVSF